MDFLWQINLEDMLGGLTVATFVILLASSVVVVSSMVLFPLIDLALEKQVKPTTEEPRKRDGLATHDQPWQIGRPWLQLRSDFSRPDAIPHSQVMPGLTPKRAGVGALGSSSSTAAGALSHTTLLIKRTKTATQNDENLIVPTNESDPQPALPPKPVETVSEPSRAA